MMKKYFLFFSVLFLMLGHTPSFAKIKTEVVEYKDGDQVLEGYVAYDDKSKAKRPGVVIVHAWMGLDEYAKRRAREVAGLGYVAFAADIYGKGVRPKNQDEAGKKAGEFKENRAMLRQRVTAAYNQLKSNKLVDNTKLGAMGYCFGGTTALELARSGVDLAGVVSFHGGLATPTPADAKSIKGKVLVLHGADDPFVPTDEVLGFAKEMREGKVDWELVQYGNAVHSFTHNDAGNDNSKGQAYNASADKRSWEAMKDFFQEVFGKRG